MMEESISWAAATMGYCWIDEVFTPVLDSVRKTLPSSAITCYPNPTDGDVTIRDESQASLSRVMVTNILGQILINKNLDTWLTEHCARSFCVSAGSVSGSNQWR